MNLVRAASHVHSEWSYDGKWRLEALAQSFSRRGYRIVLVTEHDQGFDESKRMEHRAACASASSDKILLIPGIEYSDPSNVIHLLVWGDVPFIGSGVTTDRVLSAAKEFGGLVVFAHPTRKEAWKQFNPIWKENLLGIEFWNRKTDGWAASREAWSLLQGTGLVPFAGLDFHDARQFFPMATIFEMDVPINEGAVLMAMGARRCRSKVFNLEPRGLSEGFRAKALGGAESLRRKAAQLYRSAFPVQPRGTVP